MTCSNPKWIYLPRYLPIKNAEHEVNQKRLRKPIWHWTAKNYAMQIPCGECEHCRLDHAKNWAIRCACEMLEQPYGCFITLTYNNGYCTIKGHEGELNLPLTEKGQKIYNELNKKNIKHVQIMRILAQLQAKNSDIMTLKKKDVQDFWKRLRKYLKKINEELKIRYICCGEKGEKYKRVHYHACIFGYKPQDLEIFKFNHKNQPVFKSKELQNIWGHGFVTVGELNFKTASYTARYVQKKAGINKQKVERKREFTLKYNMAEVVKIVDEWLSYRHDIYIADSHQATKNYINNFLKLNSINKILKKKSDVQEEFITCSNRPGIGLNYFINQKEKILKNNGILLHIEKSNHVYGLPPYFKKKWKEYNWEEYYSWAYQQQLKAQKDYWQAINSLNYPKEYPDWKKEQEYLKYKERIFKSKIKNLVRINYDEYD